jgi:hypothetical protein
VVSAQAAPARRGSLEALNRIVRESGGMSVAAGREEPLIASLLALPPAAAEAVQRYPMRSPWWIAPFALCLGVEWWDRRRQGLR